MSKEQNPKEAVKGYLDAKAKDDALFAEMYKKPSKSIDTCWAYIVGVAEKRGNHCVCMTDDEVYGLAVHYYCEDDLKVSPLPSGFNCRVGTSEKVTLSEEDKKRLKDEAEAEFKAKLMKELEDIESQERINREKAIEASRILKEKEEAKAAKIAAREAAKRAEKEAKTAGMGNLFGF